MRYLGIDFGTKNVGLALSDEAGTMGFPHAVLPNDGRLLAAVEQLIVKEKVEAVVMGESRAYSGGENPIAQEARAFGEELATRSGVPLLYEPETLTTQEARRMPDGSRMKGEPAVDASAAALILTSYLSRS